MLKVSIPGLGAISMVIIDRGKAGSLAEEPLCRPDHRSSNTGQTR